MSGLLQSEYLNPRVSEMRPMVTVGPELLERFPRFSLYNSPYDAHDEGCAIDLYPHEGDWRAKSDERGANDARETAAPSPVAGEVVETRTVSAPPKPYAADDDHLIVVDTGDSLARMLHVDPAVEPGDELSRGDSLGEMVRSGFFAPWVDNHIHLGFRPPDANPLRASGSLPLKLAGLDPVGVSWDGRGTVVASGDTYAILDAPDHPAPGERFAGIAADADADGDDRKGRVGGILDGGLPHYEGGGVFGASEAGPVSLAGQQVGTARSRTVAWDDVTVLANGRAITGLSFFFAREALGAKLVCPDAEFAVGERVEVRLTR